MKQHATGHMLVITDVEVSIVMALEEAAKLHGRGAEEERREILPSALARPIRPQA